MTNSQELNDKDLDKVQGGVSSETAKAQKSAAANPADGFLSSGHTTGSNVASSGDGTKQGK